MVGFEVALAVAEVQLGDPDLLMVVVGEEAICGVEVGTKVVYDGGGVDAHGAHGGGVDAHEAHGGGVDAHEAHGGGLDVHEARGDRDAREGGVCDGDLYCILGRTNDHP